MRDALLGRRGSRGTPHGRRRADSRPEHGLDLPPYAGSFSSTYLDVCPPSVQAGPVDHIPARQALRPVLYSGEHTGPLPAYLRPDPRPLVYLTLGSVHNETPVLIGAVEGVTRLGARVLVTVGPDGDLDALGPQPEGVQVQRWVSQSDVLPWVSVVVSHGGSGTSLGALGLALPQLCLPQAADQFRNAAAVVASGAGLTLSPDEATPTAIETGVRCLLFEDRFRQAAGKVAEEIDTMPSPADVVTLLEA